MKKYISNIFKYIIKIFNKIMSQTSINKYNNQYLKCIVTKYQSSIKLLANSGSLIIHKPKDNEDRCYVYLGDTFLASGYGFENEKLLNDATRIAENYNDTINELQETDNSLAQDIANKYNNLLTELQKYVQKDADNPNDGDVSNTYLRFNEGIYVKLINVINHGREALYEDIEIKKITKTIITENNEFYTIDELNSEGDYETSLQSSIVNVPIGTVIKKIKITIEYDPHDAGYISQLIVGYANQTNTELPTNIYITYDGNYTTKVSEYTYETIFILDFNNSPELDPYIVKNEDINIISKLSAIVSGTAKKDYKYYPELESEFGIQIVSTSNAIRKHETQNLTTLTVHPLAYVKYYIDNDSVLSHIDLNNFEYNNSLLIDSNKLSYEFININEGAKRIVVSVPNTFKVINISYIPNSDNGEYNGNEEYNWSGSCTMTNNIKMKYIKVNVNCTLYDIGIQNYEDITDENKLPSGKIKLTLLNTNKKLTITNDITTEYTTENSKRFVNEIFDNLYWINDNINIDNRLGEIYRNGLDIHQ